MERSSAPGASDLTLSSTLMWYVRAHGTFCTPKRPSPTVHSLHMCHSICIISLCAQVCQLPPAGTRHQAQFDSAAAKARPPDSALVVRLHGWLHPLAQVAEVKHHDIVKAVLRAGVLQLLPQLVPVHRDALSAGTR